eukprot:2937862-Prymnesium_polylepis.2
MKESNLKRNRCCHLPSLERKVAVKVHRKPAASKREQQRQRRRQPATARAGALPGGSDKREQQAGTAEGVIKRTWHSEASLSAGAPGD